MLWFCHHHHLGKFPFQGKVYDCDTFVSMRNHSDLSQERCVTRVSLHIILGQNPPKSAIYKKRGLFPKKLDASKFYSRDNILQKRILDFSLLLHFFFNF